MGQKRHYIRMKTILPVECALADEKGIAQTRFFQGLTQNIARAGLCVSFRKEKEYPLPFKPGDMVVLKVERGLNFKKLELSGKVIWRKTIDSHGEEIVQIGVGIDPNLPAQQALFHAAVWDNVFGKGGTSVMIFLAIVSLFFAYGQQQLLLAKRKLLSEQKKLIKEINLYQESLTAAKNNIFRLQALEQNLSKQIEIAKKKLNFLSETEKLTSTRQKLEGEILTLEKKIDELRQQEASLKEAINRQRTVQLSLENTIKQKLSQLAIQDRNIIYSMYNWLKNRQNLTTGLVLSYEGNYQLADISFTYDQALAVIIFSLFGDENRAKKILTFYQKKFSEDGKIFNAYDAKTGTVREYICHSGVIAWVGIAIVNYSLLNKDDTFIPFAEKIANQIIALMDKEGGIRGGEKQYWYSTEHNLDGYAFFNLLFSITGKEKYKQLSNKIKVWLKKYAYSNKLVPVNRGKGDATIATDTFAWSIAALGPTTLINMGLDPDLIIAYAVDNCRVKVEIDYNGKKNYVEGFDFARIRNIARGGVISCEWTAQMILSFSILGDYFLSQGEDKKAKEYFSLAKFFSQELQKLIIISPSPWGSKDFALPYASHSGVDTGHGWRVPQGKYVASLSATSYALLAFKGYNPLQGKFVNWKLN